MALDDAQRRTIETHAIDLLDEHMRSASPHISLSSAPSLASSSSVDSTTPQATFPDPGPAHTQAAESPSPEAFHAAALARSLPRLFEGDGETLRIKQLLGKGGMGQVELAKQSSLRRDVAVKRIRTDSPDEAAAARYLLHESMIASRLAHPNIIPVHMLGRDADDRPCLVMRRIEGVSWETLLNEPEHPIWRRRKTWTQDPMIRHLEILMEICNAVDYAHSKGVIHRDIKPDNVMVGEFGEVYLLDWGLGIPLSPASGNDRGNDRGNGPHEGQLFFPSPVGGTPSYMAPEMVYGEIDKIEQRTDVFLLGATLHRILTGTPRNAGRTVQEAMLSAAMTMPFTYGEDVPKELAAIANKATSQRPDQRFATALALREALVEYLSHTHSHTLFKGAQERLEQLVVLTQQDEVAPQLAQIIRRLFNECRFGFLQAIDAWEGHTAAKVGLQEALEVMVEFEIDQGNLDNAVAWMGELRSPSSELASRLDALHKQQQRDQQERELLKQQAFELDLGVGRGKRTLLLVFLGCCVGSLALVLAIANRMGWLEVTYPILQGTIVLALGIVGALALRWRRQILSNTIGRKFVFFLSACMVLMALSRLAGALFGVPIAYALTFEMLLFCAFFGTGALLFGFQLLWCSGLCLLCFGVAMIWPAATYELYLFLCFFLFLFPAYVLQRADTNELSAR